MNRMGMTIGLTVLLAFSGACRKAAEPEAAETPQPAPPAETWISFAPAGEGFEILTPSAFTRTEDKVATEAGDIAYVTYMSQPSEKRAYVLVHNDMPEALVTGQDAQKMLQGARDGLVRQYRGYVDHEAPISLGEFPGLETGMQGAAQGTNFYVKSRFYLVGNRLYQIYVLVEKGYEGTADTDKYFNSFKLK